MPHFSFPWPAFLLALVAGAVLWLSGLAFGLVLAVVLLWAGSLWLAHARPPESGTIDTSAGFSTDLMGDLVEHSDTPVLVTRRERVIIANLAARKLFGGHVVDQDVRIALRHPEAIRLVEAGETGGAVIRGVTRRRDIWRVNYKVLDNDLAVFEFVNRTAEADISQAHTDFVANASHELRTPLASIIGYVETLREDVENIDPETAERFLATVHKEAKRLQSLVSDLMSLSRIEAEKHELPAGEVNLTKLVESAARDAAGPDRADRIDFESHGDYIVAGDPQQIEQLVRNLVDNALKYGATDQPVTVRLQPRGEKRVRLTVRDRGEGIAAEHIPHLTRRFYRTDPGRSRASGGTGLGLAIVKHIVERHRGRLSIESELGEGTCIEIVLPLAS
ncbi:MAG: sensor histidine kinase [Qipengyuania sp.]